ncbi:MAG TPA: type II toxin-antitoxin system RelE/ParE family toxin [Methyloceanibacter sp.]
MRISYSPRAVADLAEIGGYLAERNSRAAAAVEQRIRIIIELVGQYPASGRVLEERPGVRAIPLGNYPYRIFYTVFGNELIILHIRHTAREPIDPSRL